MPIGFVLTTVFVLVVCAPIFYLTQGYCHQSCTLLPETLNTEKTEKFPSTVTDRGRKAYLSILTYTTLLINSFCPSERDEFLPSLLKNWLTKPAS